MAGDGACPVKYAEQVKNAKTGNTSSYGARLRDAFQQLEGEATTEGLWLVSTMVPPRGTAPERLRVMAARVGRVGDAANSEEPPGLGLRQSSGAFPLATRLQKRQRTAAVQNARALPPTGTVQVADQLVRFLRPGLVEEYRVSADGVRQDFVIENRPEGSGELRVTLAVDGAQVEPVVRGVQLVLENSGRRMLRHSLPLTGLTNGQTVYWSVQAVDTAFAGDSHFDGAPVCNRLWTLDRPGRCVLERQASRLQVGAPIRQNEIALKLYSPGASNNLKQHKSLKFKEAALRFIE